MDAILITAYKDRKQLQRLINFFKTDFLVCVHLDKKSELGINDFSINKNVKIIKKYSINWGDQPFICDIRFIRIGFR